MVNLILHLHLGYRYIVRATEKIVKDVFYNDRNSLRVANIRGPGHGPGLFKILFIEKRPALLDHDTSCQYLLVRLQGPGDL